MAHESSPSAKSAQTKQHDPLETGYRHPKKSSTAEGADTSRVSSRSTLKSSTSSKRGSYSEASRSRTSAKSSAATSWSSSNYPDPRSPPADAHTRRGNAHVDAHTPQGSKPHFLHIGAQFYGVTDGGTQAVKDQLAWNTDYPYQVQPQWTASSMAPMERFQQQTMYNEPYGYMNVDMNADGKTSDGAFLRS